MTTDMTANIRASRLRVARSRGALSGVLLILLGAWAALIPFVGPYFNFAFTPKPNAAWHWTTERGVFEVLPGAAAALGGLLLLVSASRLVTSFGGWLAAASGAWLIVGPSLADPIGFKHLGMPDPASRSGVRALEELLFFFAIGAAILFVAALGLGRLSVHSVRDVRAAERRAAAEEAAAAEQAAHERTERDRLERERLERDRAERDRADRDRVGHDRPAQERAAADERGVHEHQVGERGAHDRPIDERGTQPGGPGAQPGGPGGYGGQRAEAPGEYGSPAGPNDPAAPPRHEP